MDKRGAPGVSDRVASVRVGVYGGTMTAASAQPAGDFVTRRSKPGPEPRPIEERFWAKVVKTDGCWLWTGATVPGGYGTLNRGSRGEGNIRAHRLSYEMHVGPIPEGLVLDHLCRVPACVNPDHLEAVTQRENVIRGEGPAKIGAFHRAKTHCPRGHAYDEENTYVDRGGGRSCRECQRLRRRKS